MSLNTYRVERRLADGDLCFVLPVPPSTNHLFFNVQNRGRVPTTKYESWKREAMQIISANRVARIAGPVVVSIQIEDKHPRRDCDNFCKPILDILADRRVNIIDGDSAKTVRKLSVEWANVDDVVVTIRRAA